jgi:hypothetical protein
MTGKLSQPENLPSSIKPLKLKYSGRCQCRRVLKKGQAAFYDTVNSKPLCKRCVQQQLRIISEATDMPEAQPHHQAHELIDKVKQLLTMPLPRRQVDQQLLQEALECLRTSHADNDDARKLLIEYFEIALPRSSRCIKLTYDSFCISCSQMLLSSTAAIWDSASRRTWCFLCASRCTRFRADS